MKIPVHSLNAHNITDLVVRHADRQVADARLFQVYASAVRHLHDFVREVRLSEPELQAGRDFINAAVRSTQVIPAGELHMLTDLLGVSELVELMADAGRDGLTERNLEGPLYVADPPWRAAGEALGTDHHGDKLLLSGRVLDEFGAPINGAVVDVWQAAANGLYDIQDPSQPRGNFRGRYATDLLGRWHFETVVPPGYRVPDSGPSGELLRKLGRHPWRAAHIHFKLSAPGHETLTTQLFIDRDEHLHSDTTFAVRTGLLVLREQRDAALPPAGSDAQARKPVYESTFDFLLARSDRPARPARRRRSTASA